MESGLRRDTRSLVIAYGPDSLPPSPSHSSSKPSQSRPSNPPPPLNNHKLITHHHPHILLDHKVLMIARQRFTRRIIHEAGEVAVVGKDKGADCVVGQGEQWKAVLGRVQDVVRHCAVAGEVVGLGFAMGG